MRHINIRLWTILFVLVLPAVSCENYLETELPQNQMDHTLVFDRVETAHAALAGLYGGIWEDSPLSGSSRGAGALLGAYTDDLESYSPTVPNAAYDLFLNQQIAGNTSVYTIWSNAYTKVYQANAILEGIEKSSGIGEADKALIRGETLLTRSIMYFYLQQIFGDIPVPLTTDYRINQNIGKTNAEVVLEMLEHDLLLCIQLLKTEYRNPERIYPNRHVASLMLARVYALQQKWHKAEVLLQDIAADPLYIFENNLSKVFDKSGKHILWQLKPKNSGDATKEAVLYYFANAAPSNVALSPSLIASLDSGDLRKTQWTAAVPVGPNVWHRAAKYKNRTANTTEYSIVFRLEEVYLLLAESLARQSKTDAALPYLNWTRIRAGLTPVVSPVSDSLLLDEIEKEFQREFFAEMGQRFFVLKRMDRLPQLTAVKPNWKSYHQLWPLPQKELLLNPNLNPQNTGY